MTDWKRMTRLSVVHNNLVEAPKGISKAHKDSFSPLAVDDVNELPAPSAVHFVGEFILAQYTCSTEWKQS